MTFIKFQINTPLKNILKDLKSQIWHIYILSPCVNEMLMTSYSHLFSELHKKRKRKLT